LLKSRRYSLVIVTARQQFVADLTKKFVDRHFPGIFESIYFANHYLTEQEKLTFVSKPKSVICRDVHAQLLIDDSLENAIEVAKAGIPVLLFDLQGAYKWNKLKEGEKLPDKVTRVKSWKEVQAWFPRPRSPLSTLCISRDDQISEDEESESDDEEVEDGETEHQHFGYQHHQQQQHLRQRNLVSDSDSDDFDEEEDEMNEIAKREQDEDEHHGRTLRRRKLMMMDFSSSDDDDVDLEYGENMDSDERDFDLESGHGISYVSHDDLERYHHQHETVYTGENVMEMEMEMEAETDSVSISSESTFAQSSDDMECGLPKVASLTTTTTTVSITATNVQFSGETLAIPTSEGMIVEGLTVKSLSSAESNMSSVSQADKPSTDMEDVA
ncbi:hypothetical protein BGZ49_001335, partial [Haplosporangium sp. Z 27]